MYHDTRATLTLNDDKTLWIGQDTDFTVIVPTGVLSDELHKLTLSNMRYGSVSYVQATKSALRSVRLINYWHDTRYAEPRFVVYPRKQVLIDALSRNLREACAIGEYGRYYYVLSISSEYMIIRQVGRDEHLAVFNSVYSNERLNGIRDYLLNLPISVNLRISYTLDYNTLFNWFNERYILVEV